MCEYENKTFEIKFISYSTKLSALNITCYYSIHDGMHAMNVLFTDVLTYTGTDNTI